MNMLKVFRVNYDGRNRRIVAATSQKQAAELLGMSLSGFRAYGSVTCNKEEVEIAMREPGAVWSKGYQHGAQWVLVRPNAGVTGAELAKRPR
jgi:hypothetical protein